ncbi:TetR/AcrR family transcriptional regulator [Chryseolinea lacunae]|uniref:TetR/AcrR family transcriptional regulator n=1 Tax=Chryseolinea lacunae TaxID=2801331 RepID=A0ABS1KNY8_9BACT|nr:TetR/AcrR family transcriptional regulator [Chryseolinea lacunae]MBL0741159.1 TetR/AcrR family transcriptional regulator [Chryseolinea lacunae]
MHGIKNMEKGHILKVCRHLFGRRGVHGVTMDDVARYLGVSKKTLYKIYDNKDAIVTDVVRELVEESRLELRQQSTSDLTLTNRLSTFYEFIVNQALPFGVALIYDIRKYHPAAYQLVREHKQEMILFLNDLLIEGQHARKFRTDIQTMLLAEWMFNLLEFGILEANRDIMPVKFNQSQFFDILLNGLKVNRNLN